MKKLLYFSGILAMIMAGCTDFDKPVAEVYPAAPAVKVELTSFTDSAATFVLTIDTVNTRFYAISFFKQEGDDTLTAPAGDQLLKEAAGGLSQMFDTKSANHRWDSNGSRTFTYVNLMPNTTYGFYAVASNDKGMLSPVAGQKIVTTDNLNPTLLADKKGVVFTVDTVGLNFSFTEPVKLGAGKISAKYFAPYDTTFTFTAIDSAYLHVAIKDAKVVISADSVPAGAYVFVSWEKGAFTDLFGNEAAAMVTDIEDKAPTSDCWYQAKTKSFAVTEENLTDSIGVFADYATYQVEFKFDFPVYKRKLSKKTDKFDPIVVTVTAADYSIVANSSTDKWSVKDSSLFISFPKEVPAGAFVSMQLPSGLVVDVYGNPNDTLTVDKYWQSSIPRANIVGNYDLAYTSYFDGEDYAEPFEIAADPSDPGSVILGNFLIPGAEASAAYDPTTNTLSIAPFQPILMDNDPDLGPLYYILMPNTLGSIDFKFLNDGSAISDSSADEDGILFIVAIFDSGMELVDYYEVSDGDVMLIPAE